MESTVVWHFYILLPLFKPVSLSLSRISSILKHPNKSFFNPIKYIWTSFTTLYYTVFINLLFFRFNVQNYIFTASKLTWTWNNWQSPVLSVNDSVDLEQLQIENLFVVLGRGSSNVAQGIIPMRDYVTQAVQSMKHEQKEKYETENEDR